jgi:hypothetical protein
MPSHRTAACHHGGRRQRSACNIRILSQPAGRFWTFQDIEAALFISLAVILLAVTVRRLGRAQHPTGSRQIHTKTGAREKWF